jgi:hypothetical protein
MCPPDTGREGHDGQAVGEGNRGDAVEAGTAADHGRCAGADEYEREGTDEFRKELGCNPVGHVYLLR